MNLKIKVLAVFISLFLINTSRADELETFKKYELSENFHSRHVNLWIEILKEYKGKPNVQYLEVGTYEGGSFVWMLDNILTHNTAKATGLDVFPPRVKEVFLRNLKISGAQKKVTIVQGYSEVELRKLPFNTYDIIYIDASHNAHDVFADAALCWPLLKQGGILIFDDYAVYPEYPVELKPKTAIEAFLNCYRNYLDILHEDWQVIIRKKNIPLPQNWEERDEDTFIRFGDFLYYIRSKKAVNAATREPLELTSEEASLIEMMIYSREFSGTGFTLPPRVTQHPLYSGLKKKLNF